MTENFKEVIKLMCLQFARDCGETPETKHNKIYYDNWFERFGEDYLKAIIKNSGNKKNIEQLSKVFTYPKKDIIEEQNKIEKFYDKQGNAKHYDSTRINSIIKFERIYGTIAVMTFCEISADKYRERIGKKDNQTVEQELLKISWYEAAAKYYFEKANSNENIEVDNYIKEDLPWKK